MGVSRSFRCVRGLPAPLLALYFAACATGTDPGESGEDGGSAGTLVSGAPGSGGPGGGRGGSSSGGVSGSFTGGAGSGGKSVFAGSGGATSGSGGAQSGSGGSVAGTSGSGSSGASGTGGASGGGGSSGKGGTSGMGGAGGVGGMTAGSGGISAGTGGMNGGAGGGCSNPVAKIKHSGTAMVTAADCVELTHDATWTGVNVVITSQPGTMGYPISFSFGSCRTSGTGSFTRDYEAKSLYKGENPNCSLFVQFEGAKSSSLVFVHYD